MDFSEVLRRRRMVRNYDPTPLPFDLVEKVASAAFRAPSAGNSQALGVVAVTEPTVKLAIAELGNEPTYVAAGFDPWISAAPAHIVISVSEQVYRQRYSEPDKLGPNGEQIEWPVPFWWIDAGAAMMAVLLAAVNEGLAAGFLGVHSLPSLGQVLRLPDDQVPIGIITLGRPAPDRPSSSLKRKPNSANVVVHHNHWSDDT